MYNAITKYQKKKRTRESLLAALASEIESFRDAFNELETIGRTQLIPLLDSIKIFVTRSQINDIVKCASDIQSEYAKLLTSYVKLAKGCDDVASYEAFMAHLEEASAMLHDFVLAMKNMLVAEDEIKIDNRFYRFLKLYEPQILKGLKTNNEENIEELDAKRYLNIVKNRIKPSFHKRTRARIKRNVLKSYLKTFNELNDAAKKVKIQKTSIVELKPKVPSKLIPLVTLIEEFCPL